MGKQRKQWQTFYFLGSESTAGGDYSHEIKRCLLLGRKAMTNLHCVLKRRHHFANKGLYSQSYEFSNSHVWMWELDAKEDWVLKNWCFQPVMLEKTLESTLESQQIKLKELNPDYSLEGLMLKLKLHYLATWCKELIQGKTPWCWERLRAGEGGSRGKTVTQHHWLNEHASEQTPGHSEGQGSLACCSPWGHKESDTWWLNINSVREHPLSILC